MDVSIVGIPLLQFLPNYDTYILSLHTIFLPCAEIGKKSLAKQTKTISRSMLHFFFLRKFPSYLIKSAKLVTFWRLVTFPDEFGVRN